MKKILFPLIALALFTASCTERQRQRWNKKFQFSERNYEVWMMNGGDTVYHDRFKGILNDDSGESAVYYFKGDTLFELHGDYVVKSTE